MAARASLYLLLLLTGCGGLAIGQPSIPISLQAETRPSVLMEEALPRAALSSETAERLAIRREPAYDSSTPLYRRLLVGDPAQVFAVVVDVGPVPRLWVDLNRNGDLSDDYLGAPRTDKGAYRWDIAVPAEFRGQRTVLPYRLLLLPGNVVEVQPRYGQSGHVVLDGKRYLCLVQPAEVNGQGLIWGIDLNGDGRIDGNPLSGERFDGRLPFNVEGHTYQLARQSDSLCIEPSDAEVDPKRHIAVGERAPDFSYRTLNGETGSLRSQRNWVLLDFWATWCRPCWDEIPALRQMNADKEKQPNLTVLGVSLDGSVAGGKNEAALQTFLSQHLVTWPVIYDHPQYASSVARLYNVEALPVYVLIDPQGVIRWIGRTGFQESVRKLVP